MSSRFTDPVELQRVEDLQFQFGSRSLEGKAILVPGGTGGLGACMVALLLSEGAVPVVGYRSIRTRAEFAKSSLESRFGGRIYLVEGDLNDETTRRYIWKRRGSSQALLTAQLRGRSSASGVRGLTAGDLARSYQCNFIAPVLLAKLVGEHMIARKASGSIVLLSSMQGVGVFKTA